MWDTLKLRYSQPDNVRIYQLQQILNVMTQGTLNVTQYFTALSAIWEEMRSYRPPVFCSCGNCTCLALKQVNETQSTDNTFKFLMGLNETFEGIRGQILLMNPVPTLDRIFSMVLQEERQREARVVAQPSPDMSVFAGASSSGNTKRKHKSDVICEHCEKPGHTKASCYRIIGFPTDFKFTKNKTYDNKGNSKKSSATPGYANIVQTVPNSQPIATQTTNNFQSNEDQVAFVHGNPIDNGQLGFTSTQFQRLINYLNNNPAVIQNTNQARGNNEEEDIHYSNMAGPKFGDDWSF